MAFIIIINIIIICVICAEVPFIREVFTSQKSQTAHTRTAHRRTQKELQIQTQIWYDVAAAAFIF